MATITVYGGAGEIGGNKVLLEDGDTRLFLDFGMSFGERSKYYEEFLAPRDGAGLLDLLEMGLLPPLRGIYRDDLLPTVDLWARYQQHSIYRELRVDGVLLSHAHLDHCGDISFLRPTIPVYCTAMTAFLAKATQDSGAAGLEKEVCYCNPRQTKEKEPLLADYLGTAGDYLQRAFVLADTASLPPEAAEFWRRSPAATKGMQAGELKLGATTLGALRVTHFPVDHSVYGACAWLAETSAGPVLYTGDLRRHGIRREATERLVAQARTLQPEVLLCEGTHVDAAEPPTSEDEVLEKAKGYMHGAQGKLVIADFAARDIERLQTFLRIAQETGRLLVILSKDAYLLDALGLLSDGIPNLSSHGSLRLYKELRGSLSAWERGLLQTYQDKLVRAEDVRRSPGDFILCFSFFDLNELPSIAPEGGLYIYSSSEAFDEELQIDIDRLQNWLGRFRIEGVGLPRRELDGKPLPEERGLHASGHASGPELIDFVKTVRPKLVIPIHTHRPDIFERELAGTGIAVHIPRVGEPIPIS
jgi:ribonuclease J